MTSLTAFLLGIALAFNAADRLDDDAGLGATAAGRLLLKYAVQCALPADDALGTQRGGREIALAGSLGLAPRWKKEALSDVDQRWMTACVLARINAFGVTVKLSLRGDHDALRHVDDAERRRYTFEEGAFYGNFFVDPPMLYSCAGRGGPRRAPTKRLRVCTDAAPNGDAVNRCGMTMTGRCEDVCEQHDGVYRGCRGGDRRYDEVLTVFLRDAAH